jgi:hypothetical protein
MAQNRLVASPRIGDACRPNGQLMAAVFHLLDLQPCWLLREFHPEPLTDPYSNLSIHTARATARGLPPSADHRAPPVAGSVGRSVDSNAAEIDDLAHLFVSAAMNLVNSTRVICMGQRAEIPTSELLAHTANARLLLPC